MAASVLVLKHNFHGAPLSDDRVHRKNSRRKARHKDNISALVDGKTKKALEIIHVVFLRDTVLNAELHFLT